MKGLLLLRLFLFICTSLFTINTFSQGIPDPGNDPLEPLDSIAQTINSIPVMTGQIEVLNVPSPESGDRRTKAGASRKYCILQNKRLILHLYRNQNKF